MPIIEHTMRLVKGRGYSEGRIAHEIRFKGRLIYRKSAPIASGQRALLRLDIATSRLCDKLVEGLAELPKRGKEKRNG